MTGQGFKDAEKILYRQKAHKIIKKVKLLLYHMFNILGIVSNAQR